MATARIAPELSPVFGTLEQPFRTSEPACWVEPASPLESLLLEPLLSEPLPLLSELPLLLPLSPPGLDGSVGWVGSVGSVGSSFFFHCAYRVVGSFTVNSSPGSQDSPVPSAAVFQPANS